MKKNRSVAMIAMLAILLTAAATVAMSPDYAFAKKRIIQSTDPSLQCPNTNTATNFTSTNEQQNTSHCSSTSVQQAGNDQSAAPAIQQRTSND